MKNIYERECDDIEALASMAHRISIDSRRTSEALVQGVERFKDTEALLLDFVNLESDNSQLTKYLCNQDTFSIKLRFLGISLDLDDSTIDPEIAIGIIGKIIDAIKLRKETVIVGWYITGLESEDFLSALSAIAKSSSSYIFDLTDLSTGIDILKNVAFMDLLQEGKVKVLSLHGNFGSNGQNLLIELSISDSNVLRLNFMDCDSFEESYALKAVENCISNGTLPAGIRYLRTTGSKIIDLINVGLPPITREEIVSKFQAKKLRDVDFLKQETFNKIRMAAFGASGVGKTSLGHSLVGAEFVNEHRSTKGFEIERIEVLVQKDAEQNIWVKEKAENDINLAKLIMQGKAKVSSSGDPREEVIKVVNKTALESSVEVEPFDAQEIKLIEENIKVLNPATETFVNLAFWDFAGQEVFYSVHHVFLTENSLYLVVFNAKLIVKGSPEENLDQLRQLEFWLCSLKLHAPDSPCIIVGTHTEELSNDDLTVADKNLFSEVLGKVNRFSYVRDNDEQRHFFAVDNRVRQGIGQLKSKIQSEIASMRCLPKKVPVGYMVAYDRLIRQKLDFLPLEEAKSVFAKSGIAEDQVENCLSFLTERGLLLHFPTENLKGLVIVNPQFLIRGITRLIYDKVHHNHEEMAVLRSRFPTDIKTFEEQAIVSRELLTEIWKHAGFHHALGEFFENLMLAMLLLCVYKGDDGVEGFWVPSLLLSDNGRSMPMKNEESYNSGRVFYIDFSGEYTKQTKGSVAFLPIGLFEQVICHAIQLSNDNYIGSPNHEIQRNKAKIFFGTALSVILEPCVGSSNRVDRIRCRLHKDIPQKNISRVARLIYQIMDEVKKVYHSNPLNKTHLVMVCVFESPSGQLAEYNLLREALYGEKKAKQVCNKPRDENASVKVADFSHWFKQKNRAADHPPIVPLPQQNDQVGTIRERALLKPDEVLDLASGVRRNILFKYYETVLAGPKSGVIEAWRRFRKLI